MPPDSEAEYQQLGREVDAFLERMVKLIAIAEFAERHDNPRQVKELVAVIEQLTDKMNQKINDFQSKHGEI